MDQHTAALTLMMKIFQGLSLLCLASCIIPMLRGGILVKWLITAFMGSTMFAAASLVASSMRPTSGSDLSPVPPPPPPTEIDWTRTGLLGLSIVACIGALIAAIHITRALATRRAAWLSNTRKWALALDPAAVARSMTPDLIKPVEEALARIAHLKILSDQIQRSEDADVLAMVERRVPSIMERQARASEAATDEERRDMARTALSSIIEIGELAEEARARIVRDLRDGLDTEARYVSSRAADYGLHAQ